MAKLKLTGVFTDDQGKVTNIDYPEQQINVSVGQPTPTPTPEPQPEPQPQPQPEPEPTPSDSSTPPLSTKDSRFGSNSRVSSTTLRRGQNLSRKTITDTGSTASVIAHGDNVLDTLCIESREGVRIAGSGLFTIKNTFISVNGTGQDHADGVQTYAPGSRGTIKVINSTIKCGFDQATAGFFVADNWTGTIDFEDVVIWGGPYGLRIHPDRGGNNIIRFRNVFAVGPFRYGGLWVDNRTLNGGRNIVEVWESVREATIQEDGKLIPGKLIPKPF